MAHDGFIQAQLRIEFLGLNYAPLTQATALDAIVAKANAHGAFAYVAAPRAGALIDLDRAPEARAHLYADAWLTLNGSRAVEMLAKLSRLELPRIDGVVLAQDLLAKIIHPDEKVCIVGGDAALIAAIAAKYKLNNVAWRAEPAGPDAVAQAVHFITQTRARYAFIAGPAAEAIADAVRRSGAAAGVGLCISAASLATLGGRARRAPDWVARARLAWAWRLWAERTEFVRAAGLLEIWRYWLCALFAEPRASISARSAF